MMDKVNPSSFEYIQTDLSLGDSSEEEGIRAFICWLMVQRVANGGKALKQEQVLNAAH